MFGPTVQERSKRYGRSAVRILSVIGCRSNFVAVMAALAHTVADRGVRETPTLLYVTQELISLFAIIAILLKRWFHSKNLSDVNRRFKPPSTETDLQIHI